MLAEDDGVFKVPGSQNLPHSPKAENYELATHTVKVRRTGALADVMAIWDLPGTCADLANNTPNMLQHLNVFIYRSECREFRISVSILARSAYVHYCGVCTCRVCC